MLCQEPKTSRQKNAWPALETGQAATTFVNNFNFRPGPGCQNRQIAAPCVLPCRPRVFRISFSPTTAEPDFSFSMSDPKNNPTPDQTAQAPVFDPPLSPEEIEAAAAAEAAATGQDSDLAQELQNKVATLADQVLRAQAEVQNTRRRAEEDVAKARKFALEGFAESLLAVVDSLDAALQVENATAEQLREGTVATHRQLLATLERNKVLEVNPAAGDKFDPGCQQAISVVPSEHAPGTVVNVLQKGYMLADRVLRPALVTVAASE